MSIFICELHLPWTKLGARWEPMHAQQSSWPIVFSFHTSHPQPIHGSMWISNVWSRNLQSSFVFCFWNLSIWIEGCWRWFHCFGDRWNGQGQSALCRGRKMCESLEILPRRSLSNLCISLCSFAEEDAQPQDCVQRVAHILSSLPTKCWFWHFCCLVDSFIFGIQCLCMPLQSVKWRLVAGCMNGCRLRWWRSFSISWAIYWLEWTSLIFRTTCSALLKRKQKWSRENMLNFATLQRAVLLRQLGAQDLFKVKTHQDTMKTQTNVATPTLTDSGMKFISLRVEPEMMQFYEVYALACAIYEPGTKCVLCGPCAMPAKLSAAAAWAEAARFEASFCSSVVAAMADPKTANRRCHDWRGLLSKRHNCIDFEIYIYVLP